VITAVPRERDIRSSISGNVVLVSEALLTAVPNTAPASGVTTPAMVRIVEVPAYEAAEVGILGVTVYPPPKPVDVSIA